jgi:hypothetical protein
MTVPFITALRAAETLAIFHLGEVENVPPGDVQNHHQDMVLHCLADVEDIKQKIVGADDTVENQARTLRQFDLTVALSIIERHNIMLGIGMPLQDAVAARMAMAREIADALQAARGGTE